jgi:acetate kinase
MTTRILVINSGSSSIKYQLRDMDTGGVPARGVVERIGEDEGIVTHTLQPADGGPERIEERLPVADHDEGFRRILAPLDERSLLENLGGIGHRVVHGGELYDRPTVVDDDDVEAIRRLTPLAPLHNPPNARGIEVARALRPDVPHVAVFDTSFHRTMPPHAFRYAIPKKYYTEYDVRRYGMHGTSHRYVAGTACAALGLDPDVTNLITAHLGNGASMAAIAAGRCIDTSMGLSPLEGLVMGTRSGDLDPAVVFHLEREAGMTPDEVETMLNHQSGLKGLCGDNDVRVIEQRAEEGDADAELALDVFCYRIRKYIGAYTAALGRLDVLVFTAGIGEHSPTVRRRACQGLEVLGIALDERRNADAGDGVQRISVDSSQVTVLVVPTNEEREIAEQTAAAIGLDVPQPSGVS